MSSLDLVAAQEAVPELGAGSAFVSPTRVAPVSTQTRNEAVSESTLSVSLRADDDALIA